MSREPNGNADSGSWSFWLRAIAWIGIPGAIAMYLVYMGAQTIPALQQAEALNKMQLDKLQDLLREDIAQQTDVLRLMQRICANTAHDSAERGRCFEAR